MSTTSTLENEIVEEIDIDVHRDADEDRFDNHREARPSERWHASLDNLARNYRDIAAELAEKHDQAGYRSRMKHLMFGIPGPVISIIVSSVTALWETENIQYFVIPLSALGAILGTIHTFLDMGGKAEKHWGYSASYSGVVATIDGTLASDIDFRRQADEFFSELRTHFQHLNATAPQLPGKGFCGFSKYENHKKMPDYEKTQRGSIHYMNVS